ncbi:MAG: AAA family ATPase, partial [Actinomycetota bacterium]
TRNPAGFRFCGGCGGSLERPCSSCGAGVPFGFRFCGSCGAALGGDPPVTEVRSSIDEERKVVSVVFADLVASTELATKLDPEDLREVYRPYFEVMAEEIARHGGSIEKFIGDAIVGVFGAPAAHEDDPIRAVRAALGMQAKLPDLNRRLAPRIGGDLAMRVGVHTGEVLSAPGSDREGIVTGESTTIAARLQGVAPAGGIVVSERTHRGTRRVFDFTALGEMELKGLPGPLPVWLVIGEGEPEPGAFASALVGRRDELELLGLLLRRCAKEVRPYVATVVGPAGIGKSRLAHEFAQAATRGEAAGKPAECRVVRGRCHPYGEGLHLWPLAEILKGDAGILDSDPPAAILDKARALLVRRLDGDAGSPTIPTLLSSVGIPIAPDPLAGAGRETAERMITDAWSRYLVALSGATPVVVVIEDIHWADAGLLALLDRLASRTAAPVLFLCLARPEVFDRRPNWGSGRANFATLELSPLSASEESALVENLLDREAASGLVAAIVGRAEGNPFFASELLRMLVEDGTIVRIDDVWTLPDDLPSDLPDTVQGAIAARIDRLSPTEKRAIQDAAVVGRVFWEGVLEALGTPDVASAVDALVARGLVHTRAPSTISGSREFSFAHALTRDVAYGSIPRARRAEAHAAVLDWIEGTTRGRDEEFAELMAHHAAEAGDAERTARYATLAGHRHRRVYAADEAIEWYERALAAADELPAETTTVLVSEIAYSRGGALEQLSRYDEAQADYGRALELARGTGRTWWEAQILAALTHVLWLRDRYGEAEALLPGALEAAKLAGTPDIEARLHYTAGAIAWARGDWAGSLASHEEALRIAQDARDLEGEAYARHGLTDTRSFIGPLDEALAQATKARELWRALGQRPMGLHNDQMLGWVYVLLGRFDEAVRTIDETVAGHRELGQRRDEVITLTARVLAELGRGELGPAAATAGEAVELARSVGAPRPEYLSVLIRMLVHAELGADAPARRDLPLATSLSDGVGFFFHPPLLSARGWLELAAADREPAVRSFSEGRRLAEGGLLHQLLCGRFEVRAWEAAADPDGLRDAAGWLLKVASGSSPPYEALATTALARADELEGDLGAEAARTALRLAEEAGDLTVVWRACSLAASVADDPDDAARLRGRASEIVRFMVASLDDRELRDTFRGRPQVAALISDD